MDCSFLSLKVCLCQYWRRKRNHTFWSDLHNTLPLRVSTNRLLVALIWTHCSISNCFLFLLHVNPRRLKDQTNQKLNWGRRTYSLARKCLVATLSKFLEMRNKSLQIGLIMETLEFLKYLNGKCHKCVQGLSQKCTS